MKKFYLSSAVIALFLCLAACNSGYNLTTPTAPQTYSFTNVASSVGGNCNTLVNPYICSAESSTITLNITFTSNPEAYLQLPTPPLQPGLTMTTVGSCVNAPVTTYTCSITFVAQNTQSGSNITIPVSGSLGQQNYYSINFQ